MSVWWKRDGFRALTICLGKNAALVRQRCLLKIFVQFGIKSRLIRINERSAAGDPFEGFPKGNSLQRLEGAFVLRVGCTPLILCATVLALLEAATVDRHGERTIT